METLFSIGLTSAVIATMLAIVVWCVTCVWRQPPLVALLWTLVLVKLITPPLVAIPWRFEPSAAGVALPTDISAEPSSKTAINVPRTHAPADSVALSPRIVIATHDTTTPPLATPHEADSQHKNTIVRATPSSISTSEPLDWISLIATVWLSGTAIWLLVAIGRLTRFHRALRHTDLCAGDIPHLANEVAARLGVTSSFRLRTTDARLSPFVWPIGRPTIVLSRPLLATMSREETEMLLTHELAHVRRKDHWLRWLEFAVTAIYWWHPVVWWARHKIQTAEEQACDAWVVWAFPESAERYASALFKAVQMATEHRSLAPLVASRLGSTGKLKERIEDIMNATWTCRLTKPARIALTLFVLLILPLSLRSVTAASDQSSESNAKTKSAADQKTESTSAHDKHSTSPTADKPIDNRAQVTTSEPVVQVADQIKLPAKEPGVFVQLAVKEGTQVKAGQVIGKIDDTEPQMNKVSTNQPRVRVPANPYRIAAGDVLHVAVANAFADQPIGDDYLVESEGTIALGPAYGRANVAGMTLEEADRAVTKQLGEFIDNPVVQVTIGGWRVKTGSRVGHPESASASRQDAHTPASSTEAVRPIRPEELAAFREHVAFLKNQFAKVEALYKTGSRGGSADSRALAGYELAATECDLALAEGHVDEAIAHGQKAEQFAENAMQSTTASYESGRVSLQLLLEVARNLADSKLRLSRIRQSANASPTSAPSNVSIRSNASQELANMESATNTLSLVMLRKMFERRKSEYERSTKLVAQGAITASELEKVKEEYELSADRLQQAQRERQYRKVVLELAQAEYQQSIEANKRAAGAVSSSELRRQKILVELAEAKLNDIGD